MSKPISYHQSRDTIANLIMIRVRHFFQEKTNHDPSEDMLRALKQIPETLLDVVSGRAEPKMFVCPLDTGIGKTTTLAHSIKFLRENLNQDFGAIMCLGRYSQIIAMINDMGLAEDEYAVLVSENVTDSQDKRYVNYGLGHDRIDDAPILLTTHAMMEEKLADPEAKWSEAKTFFYKGKARQVRVWDESLDMRQGITLSDDDLLNAMIALPKYKTEFDEVRNLIKQRQHGEVLRFPDWVGEDETYQGIMASIHPKNRGRIDECLPELIRISGRPVLVIKEGVNLKVIQYHQVLPPDLKPVLVLDASARVRTTYDQKNEKDKDVITLAGHGVKKYDRVRVHYQHGKSGKGSLRKVDSADRWRLIDDIYEVLKTTQGRSALILHHKDIDIEGALEYKMKNPGTRGLRALPPDDLGRYKVRFCTWGMHNATNEFTDCDVVVCAGIFYKPQSVYHATGRAASDTAINKPYDNEKIDNTKIGEILHELLQGISRGSLRNCVGDQARACDVYVQAGSKSGLQGLLCTKLFPGAQLLGWNGSEIKAPKPDRNEQVMEFISQWFRDPDSWDEPLPVKLIYQDLDIHQNHMARHLNSDRVKKGMARLKLEIQTIPGKRGKHVVRILGNTTV